MGRAVANVEAAAPLFRGEVLRDIDCVVCGKPLSDPSVGVRKTACGHLFCSECISRWLSRNALCPLCNHDLTLEGGTVYVQDEQDELQALLDTAFGPVTVATTTTTAAAPASPASFAASSSRPVTRRGGARPDVGSSGDVLTDVVANVTAIMDRAKADVIAEVARAVARLERSRPR